MPLKKIIVATDFSTHAEYALKRAISIAELHCIPLEFIHVLKQPWPANFVQFTSNNQQQALLELQKGIEKKLSDLLKRYPSTISVNISVLLGRSADEITRYAQESQGNLIIVGAHGQHHISDYVLGTTSGDIVIQGYTPVLLIKKEPSFSYKSILVATDYSDASKRAVEFAFLCFPEARFQLLHILDTHEEQYFKVDKVALKTKHDETKDMFEKIDDFLKNCDVEYEKFNQKIIGGYLADSIIKQSQSWNADLLVFGTQGRSKLHYLLMGSVAKRLLQLSHIDILAVPPNF